MKEKRNTIMISLKEVDVQFEEHETVEALEFIESIIEKSATFFEEYGESNPEEVYEKMKKEESKGNTIFIVVNDEDNLAWISMPEPYGVLVSAINDRHLRFDFVVKITSKEFYENEKVGQ